MATAAAVRTGDEHCRKRLKLADLPLAASQRTAINGVLHAYKKRGSFDTLRKTIWSSFESSISKCILATDITTLAENEIERNPTLLAKDRRLAAPLIEGAAERSGVYSKVESDVESLIESLLGDAGSELRALRRGDIGEAAANDEERKGAKTDEEYVADAASRRQQRAKLREEEIRKARQKELEALRKREQELMKQREERERIAKEKEELRQKALAAENAKHDAEVKERAERKARQDAQWAAEQKEREERARREREKNIKEAALEELLSEGKRAAARSAGIAASPLRGSTSSTKKESAIDEIMRREKMERGEPVIGLERVDSTTSRRLIKRRNDSEAKPSSSVTPLPPAAKASPVSASQASPVRSDENHPQLPANQDPPSSLKRYEEPEMKPRRDSDHLQHRRQESENAKHHVDPPGQARQPLPSKDGNASGAYRHGSVHPTLQSHRSGDANTRHTLRRDREGEHAHNLESLHRDERKRDYETYKDDTYGRRSSRDDLRLQYSRVPSDRQDSHASPSYRRDSNREDGHRSPAQTHPHREEPYAPPTHHWPHRDQDVPSSASQRVEKNNTPAEIDRYVPSTSARAARPNDSVRTKIVDRAAEDEKHPRRRSRSRERERSRNHDRERDRDRDRRRRRSYSRSRSRSRDRDRERRHRYRDRDYSRERDRDRDRRRDRSRSRDDRRRRSISRSRARR